MKTCRVCGQNVKMTAARDIHPKCADKVSFYQKHDGWPVFCSSRGEARKITQDLQQASVQIFLPEDVRGQGSVKGSIKDAGKGNVHPDSFKFFRNGTRWAVAVSLVEKYKDE